MYSISWSLIVCRKGTDIPTLGVHQNTTCIYSLGVCHKATCNWSLGICHNTATLPYSSFRIVLSTSKSVWLRISSATSVEHDPTGAMLIFTIYSLGVCHKATCNWSLGICHNTACIQSLGVCRKAAGIL
jgi:hypothetical protein